jgi:hypothetical protein
MLKPPASARGKREAAWDSGVKSRQGRERLEGADPRHDKRSKQFDDKFGSVSTQRGCFFFLPRVGARPAEQPPNAGNAPNRFRF